MVNLWKEYDKKLEIKGKRQPENAIFVCWQAGQQLTQSA